MVTIHASKHVDSAIPVDQFHDPLIGLEIEAIRMWNGTGYTGMYTGTRKYLGVRIYVYKDSGADGQRLTFKITIMG